LYRRTKGLAGPRARRFEATLSESTLDSSLTRSPRSLFGKYKAAVRAILWFKGQPVSFICWPVRFCDSASSCIVVVRRSIRSVRTTCAVSSPLVLVAEFDDLCCVRAGHLKLLRSSGAHPRSGQNVYFNPSCIWRMGMPKAKLLMVPKPAWGAPAGAPGTAAPARMLALGCPQFGWFSRLNASARN